MTRACSRLGAAGWGNLVRRCSSFAQSRPQAGAPPERRPTAVSSRRRGRRILSSHAWSFVSVASLRLPPPAASPNPSQFPVSTAGSCRHPQGRAATWKVARPRSRARCPARGHPGRSDCAISRRPHRPGHPPGVSAALRPGRSRATPEPPNDSEKVLDNGICTRPAACQSAHRSESSPTEV